MDKAIKTPNRTGILVRALIVLAMCGIVNSAAVFVSPMAKHFGWTTEAIAGVATYMAFMQTPGHILSGWLLGKIGAKKTLILGCILLGLAFLLSGMVPSGSPLDAVHHLQRPAGSRCRLYVHRQHLLRDRLVPRQARFCLRPVHGL